MPNHKRRKVFESLALAFLALGCTSPPPPPEGMERFEFLSGGTLCVQEGLVTDQWGLGEAFAPEDPVSITVTLPKVGKSSKGISISIMRSPSRAKADYRDLALFMEKNPEAIQLDPQRDVYQLDVQLLPPTQGKRQLIDRLIPGDGSRILMLSKAIRKLTDPQKNEPEDPADIFYARCGVDGEGVWHCHRQFPFHQLPSRIGFYGRYPLPENWSKEWIERDKEIRAFLSQVAIVCE